MLPSRQTRGLPKFRVVLIVEAKLCKTASSKPIWKRYMETYPGFVEEVLKETSAWKSPWNRSSREPFTTTNKLITPCSLYEEDKSRDFSGSEMTCLISRRLKRVINVECEKPYWAAWSRLYSDSAHTSSQAARKKAICGSSQYLFNQLQDLRRANVNY